MYSMGVTKSNIAVVRMLLKDQKKTAKQLADHLGITRSAVYSMLERNKTDTETLVKLCHFFECEVSEFFEYAETTGDVYAVNDPNSNGCSTISLDYKEKYIELLEQNYRLIKHHLQELQKK